MAIDSHFHIWQLARNDYGWLNPAVNPALAPICRNVATTDWQRQAAPMGIDAGILVQAAPTEAETVFLLQQAERHPGILGVVGWVDWLAPDAPERIHKLAKNPRLKGLRPMLQDIPDPAWMLQPALQPALEAMADCGLVFDALVKPQHLPHLLALAQRHPALKIVIDHGGKPDIAAQQWQPWADGMAGLAQGSLAWCKVSGLLTEAGPQPATTIARPWMQHLANTFGPNRLLWGSDWPVLELSGASYGDWWQECQDWVSGWHSAEQLAFWGGNARKVYSLQAGAG